MGTISVTTFGADPQTVNAANLNALVTPIITECNGNLDNTNIKAAAGIVDTKLATISTAGKVSGAALTGLASIPSGAGVIPAANLPTVTAYGVTGSFKKLKIVYTTAATVTVTADEIILNNSTKISSVNFTCDVANGAGLNKLDTGTESADAWYYIYAVDATHGFLSASATSPTTGTVGTIYALVGVVRNTGGDFIPFTQYGNKYCYTTWLTIASGSNKASTTTINMSTFVPSSLSYNAFGSISGNGINGCAIGNVSGFTQQASSPNIFGGVYSSYGPVPWFLDILTANTLYWYATASSGDDCYVYISGFEITSLT